VGFPPVEEYKNDYPESGTADHERELATLTGGGFITAVFAILLRSLTWRLGPLDAGGARK
jgi:hypothetical protein